MELHSYKNSVTLTANCVYAETSVFLSSTSSNIDLVSAIL